MPINGQGLKIKPQLGLEVQGLGSDERVGASGLISSTIEWPAPRADHATHQPVYSWPCECVCVYVCVCI